MNREKAEAFIATAMAELELCQNEAQVVAWDSNTSSHREYLELTPADIGRLEAAYHAKVRELVGGRG